MLGGDGVGSRKEGSGAAHRLSLLLSLMLLFAVGRFGGGLRVVAAVVLIVFECAPTICRI